MPEYEFSLVQGDEATVLGDFVPFFMNVQQFKYLLLCSVSSSCL